VEGKLVETTDDWYAQDDKGNVWYMGEDTTDFTNKKNPHEGSWESGVKGARGGIIMLAEPKVGITYDQEFAKNVAEDKATCLDIVNWTWFTSTIHVILQRFSLFFLKNRQ
jgi:hypothetical protein